MFRNSSVFTLRGAEKSESLNRAPMKAAYEQLGTTLVTKVYNESDRPDISNFNEFETAFSTTRLTDVSNESDRPDVENTFVEVALMATTQSTRTQSEGDRPDVSELVALGTANHVGAIRINMSMQGRSFIEHLVSTSG